MRAIRMLVFVCGLLSGSFAQERMAPTAARVNSAVEQLDSFIRASMTSTKVPGVAVAVVYNDKVVFLRGYGARKVGEPAPVDPDTVFEIASFSKPIASSIVASLVGEGKVSWDDRVAPIEPGFKLSSAETTRQITIRDFLSHRSGLATESGTSSKTSTTRVQKFCIACGICLYPANWVNRMPTAISATPQAPSPRPRRLAKFGKRWPMSSTRSWEWRRQALASPTTKIVRTRQRCTFL